MKIIGIGIDLVETDRLRKAYEKYGQKFLTRLFSPAEIKYSMDHQFFETHLAARFAAKEAVAKAFGTGIGAALGWLDMEVIRHPSGAPGIDFHGKGRNLCDQRGVTEIMISLTHAKSYSAANAILLGL